MKAAAKQIPLWRHQALTFDTCEIPARAKEEKNVFQQKWKKSPIKLITLPEGMKYVRTRRSTFFTSVITKRLLLEMKTCFLSELEKGQ